MIVSKNRFMVPADKLVIEIVLSGDWLEDADLCQIEAAIDFQLDDLIDEHEGIFCNGNWYRSKIADTGKGCLHVTTKISDSIVNDYGDMGMEPISQMAVEFVVREVNKKFGRRLAVHE